MKRVLLAIAALAMAGSTWAGPGPDRAARAEEQLVPDPDWLAGPSFEERAKAYPKAALEAGLGGEAVLRCRVKPDGSLADCALIKETPAAKGFGQAALAMADRFRMKPEAIPHPAPGQTEPVVLVPIRWSIVDHPDWARMPSGDELASLYPEAARQQGLPGWAEVQCEVKLDGTLTNCLTVEEAPAGMGFGDATIRAAIHYFRMKPGMLDGKPIDGALVTIPLRWMVEGGSSAEFRIGDGSRLIVALKPGAKPARDTDTVLACPSATDKARKCLAVGMYWVERPSTARAWEVINRHHLVVGVTWLSCRVGEDGALRNCVVSGEATPDKEAAMRELAAELKAAPKTWRDSIPTQCELVLVKFDWALLRTMAKPAPGASH